MYTKLQKNLIIFGPITFLLVVFLIFHSLNKQIQAKQDALAKQSITITYAQDLKNREYQKKHPGKQTPQEIAKNIMLESVGLEKNQSGYSLTGINKDDGIFVKQGVINGNMVPYSSDFNEFNDNDQNIDFSDFDAQDKMFWKKVKQNDFEKIKNNAKATVDSYQNNNQKYQEQEITNAVRQAQYDAQKSGTLIQSNQQPNQNQSKNSSK